MKSVLISIHPKWCELIASGKKTVEVRKTRPKIETPFKCYIYESKYKKYDGIGVHWENGRDFIHNGGKVIGEFVCDDIKTYYADDFVGAEDSDGTIIKEPKDGVFAYWIPEEKETCLPYWEILAYGNGKTLYGWHISDLKIYGRPKELEEFFRPCPFPNGDNYSGDCLRCDFLSDNDYGGVCTYVITSPPQSWCYVDEN